MSDAYVKRVFESHRIKVKKYDSPLLRYQMTLDKLKVDFEKRKLVLNELLRTFQDKCPHKSTQYYPDPSGNHDSCTQCNICGKDL